jgi:hypothetical protein
LIRPTPFCILDEIDAPLDEENIGRFTGVLRALSKVRSSWSSPQQADNGHCRLVVWSPWKSRASPSPVRLGNLQPA